MQLQEDVVGQYPEHKSKCTKEGNIAEDQIQERG
jgi:hypothetical protein